MAALAVGLAACVAAPVASVRSEEAALDLSSLERIDVQPQQVHLRSPREQAILLVTGYFADGRVVDLTRDAAAVSSLPTIADCRDGAVRPAGNGECEVTVELGGKQATVKIVVEGFDAPDPISFRTETVAALTRQGCNSGACHGSPSGKGGFQLSLQAYDHALDELALTRADRGRRNNAVDPAQSLLLLKPTMAVAHRGGLQLRTTDYAYDVLRQWIAEGSSVDAAEGTRCVRLELLPASGRVLKHPHLEQQIVARAHFDDGSVRDVTRLVRFSSSDDQIATVTGDGLLVGQRRGQVAVMARYLDQLVSCQFTLVQDVEGFVWPDPPAHNYIDELVYEKARAAAIRALAAVLRQRVRAPRLPRRHRRPADVGRAGSVSRRRGVGAPRAADRRPVGSARACPFLGAQMGRLAPFAEERGRRGGRP
jgi:hypothetical protein